MESVQLRQAQYAEAVAVLHKLKKKLEAAQKEASELQGKVNAAQTEASQAHSRLVNAIQAEG